MHSLLFNESVEYSMGGEQQKQQQQKDSIVELIWPENDCTAQSYAQYVIIYTIYRLVSIFLSSSLTAGYIFDFIN